MLRKWCEVTTCNGVIDLYESKDHIGKFTFWAVVLTLMSAVSAWFTYNTIVSYMETPVVTKVSTVNKPTIELPDVMIWYNGGLNVTAMRSEGWSDSLITLFSMALTEIPDMKYPTNSKEELTAYMKSRNLTISQIIQKFGYRCQDLIDDFQSSNITNSVCQNRTSVISWIGNYFVFHYVGVQNFPDITAGIRVHLLEPKNSFYHVFPKFATKWAMFNSFSIALERDFGYERSTRPVIVPTNTSVRIILNLQRHLRLRSAKTCDDSAYLFNSNTCFFLCYTRYLNKTCNCVNPKYWTKASGVEICNPFTYNECNNNVSMVEVRKCQNNCLPKCDEWLFEKTLTYTPLYEEALDQPVSLVWIYYEAMQYTQIEEVEAFTLDTAIANVGGQSNLWLGISVVTVIQAFYYLLLSVNQIRKSKSKIISNPISETDLSSLTPPLEKRAETVIKQCVES